MTALVILAESGVLVFGLVAGVIIFIACIVLLAIHLEKKRTAALAAVASDLNLAFYPKGEALPLAELSQFHLTSQGHARILRNLMLGTAQGVDVAIFDYRFTIGHGKNSSTHTATVARFRAPDLQLPHFSLRPENLFHKIGTAFGYQDIDIPGHPAFSKRFLLRGTDEAGILRLFDTELVSALEQMPGVSAEAQGNQFLFYRASKTSKPEAIRAFLEEGFRAYTHFADASKRTAAA